MTKANCLTTDNNDPPLMNPYVDVAPGYNIRLPEMAAGYWQDGKFHRSEVLGDPKAEIYVDVVIVITGETTCPILLNESGWLAVTSQTESGDHDEDIMSVKPAYFSLSLKMREFIYAKLKEDGFPMFGDYKKRYGQQDHLYAEFYW